MLSFSSVQTALARKLTNYVNKTYQTDLQVKKLDLSYLGQLKLKDVLIKDTKKDTIIYANSLNTSLLNFKKIIDEDLQLGSVYLSDVIVVMKTYKNEDDDELHKFIDKFDKKKEVDKVSEFLLTSKHVFIEKAVFTLIDENKQKDPIVSYRDISGEVQDFKVAGPNIFGKVRGMQTIDLNGVKVINMDTDFSYSKTQMQFIDSYLQTPTSGIRATIFMNYNDGDLSDFLNKVVINANITQADVSLSDMKKFYAELGTKDTIHFTTDLVGTLNNFKTINLALTSDQNAVIKGNMHFINSFNTENGFQLIADITHLESDYYHLKSLLPDILGRTLPKSFITLGHFSMSGHTNITKETIKAKLNTQSDIGVVNSDLIISNIDNIDNAVYEGKVSLRDIKLGELIGDPLIGDFSMDTDVIGRGFSLEKLDSHIKGTVLKHQYKGYTYQNIEVEGNVKDKLFSGNIKANDPNIKFDFKGLADLSKKRFKFDFSAHVDYAEFNKLNLFKRDSVSILKGDIKMAMIGNKLENMVGFIQFDNATYSNQQQDYHFKDFNIISTVIDSIQTLKINSTDIVNGQIKGKFVYKDLVKLVQNAVGSIYTNYRAFEVGSNQYLDFRFKVYNHVVAVFFPDITLGANTSIRGKINSDNNLFKLTLKSPEVLAYDNYIEKIRLQIDNKNPIFNTQLSADKIETKLYKVSDFDLVNITLNDTLHFQSEFKGGKSFKDKYSLAFYHTINENNQSIVGFKKSNINFNKTDWVLNPKSDLNNKIVFDNTTGFINYKYFLLSSKGQNLMFYGTQEGANNQNYNIDLDRINLSEILPDIEDFKLTGLINGGIWIERKNGMLIPTADIQLIDLSVNNEIQGDLIGEIKGTETNKKYEIDFYLEKEEFKNITAKGAINFKPKKPTIDLVFDLDNFKIDILNAIGKGVMEDIRGNITGKASIKGLITNPDFSGELALNNSGMFFPYINVDYTLEDNSKIYLNNQSFIINDAKVYDTLFETTATLSGNITHNKFKKWYLDLQIATANLLAINTAEEEDSMFYGTGFLNGVATFTGDTDNVNIAINGFSNPGTEIIIPMSDLKTVETSHLIHFKSYKTDKTKSRESIRELLSERFSGVTMDFNLGITKDATIQIVIDKSTGSSLQGNGTGSIQMEIDTKGTFNMYGNYIVDKGYYNFRYGGGIIDKPFAVKKGGSISFNGDPYKAELDIEAIYTTKANPKAILTNYDGTRRLPIDLKTKLTGELFNSRQEFDINIPNASLDISSELDFVLNDKDTGNMMIQFVSLLTMGSFFNSDNKLDYTTSSIGNEGVHSVAALVSNALLDVFSNPDDKLQFGFDYTQGNSITDTEDQLGVSIASRLGKNEKIIINGEVSVPTGSQSNANIAGNVSVELPLNKKESIRMKVFNRQNDPQFTNEIQGYTQGMGLLWHFSFDKKSKNKNDTPIKKETVSNKEVLKKEPRLKK
jgi:hypothetical protein